MGAKKNFVIDTNVILHDYNCLKNFQENDIYLPIVVLEELDKFKKGNEQINFNAREFLRELDLITDDHLFTKGSALGEGLGRLFVVGGAIEAPNVWQSFPERIPDHQILAVVDFLTRKKPKMKTILVTKDVNLRMKTRSIGLLCEDYINDKVVNADVFEQNNETYEGVDPSLIDRIYSTKEGLDTSEFEFSKLFHPNECFVLKSDRNSVLARYNPFTRHVCRVSKSKHYGIEPRNAEQAFAFEVLCDPDIKLVALTGKAGTGKTLLALAAALSQLTLYKQILLARPIVALSNRDIGFLPGDAQEKVAPYMQPLFDNLNVIKHQFAANSTEVKRLEEMQKSDQLVIEALAFIRGRSLSDTFCIVDEAQNLTPHEIKTI
ncbi:MAG: PhoH family protein, partial [Prevotellaceae bacterium]|nr:PhoH family protein [Prevotellaceae bacterium]